MAPSAQKCANCAFSPRRVPRASGREGNIRSPPYHGLVHDAFAPGGALAATLPGFEARREQAALAEAVDAALARRRAPPRRGRDGNGEERSPT